MDKPSGTLTDEGWVSDLGWDRTSPDSYMLIRAHKGRYRLTEVAFHSNGLPDSSLVEGRCDVWESDTPEECLEILLCRQEHRVMKAAHGLRPVTVLERNAPIPGVTLKATRNLVQAFDKGREVGRLQALYTDWKATWILGRPTLNNGSLINKSHQGKGLGKAMYDLMEEANGLPLVPHSLFGVGGSLSDQALSFWKKRVRHRHVPGFDRPELQSAAEDDPSNRVPGSIDPDVRKRLGRMERVDAILYAESYNGCKVELALALSLATGWPMEAAVRVESGRQSIIEAWCVSPDGTAFTGCGFEPRETIHDRIATTAPSLGFFSVMNRNESTVDIMDTDPSELMVRISMLRQGTEFYDPELTLAEVVEELKLDVLREQPSVDVVMNRHLDCPCPNLEAALRQCDPDLGNLDTQGPNALRS